MFMGDLHGDVRSLVYTIQQLNDSGILSGFKIADSDTHLVFLGDYTDRGNYGVEVIYTLLQLRLHNPNNVWMARGNHEAFSMVSRYGFLDEVRRKFGDWV